MTAIRRLFAALLILVTALSVVPSAMAQPHWRPFMQDSFDWPYNQLFDFRTLTSTINLGAFDAYPVFLESLRARRAGDLLRQCWSLGRLAA